MATAKFSDLSLPKAMLDNLNKLGFESMTPIQEESLPVILNNQDVIAQAKTGSGKTAAFGIGLLHKLDLKKTALQSLVLCPTRELADQVAKELRRIAKFAANIKILTLSGGVPFKPQKESLKHTAHIVVGTPGRVLKHLINKNLSLNDVTTLVLDEGDRMLDMGFIEEITHVIKFVPAKRQTLLFSATYPEEIKKLSSSIQKNARLIETVATEVANEVTEYFYETGSHEKLEVLLKLIAKFNPQNVLIFCEMKSQTVEVVKALHSKGIDALAINGNMEQYQRNDVLIQFTNKSCCCLVATDVAARGLDIKELSLVVNYTLPQDHNTYIHRIGRTARAGNKGISATFYTPGQTEKIKEYPSLKPQFVDIKTLKHSGGYSLQAPFITVVIEGGKKNKIRPGDILGALTGDVGLEGKSIGKIDINDTQSYVAIDRNILQSVFSRIKAAKIKGKKFPIWVLE